jgi:subtilase family serine protease
MEPLEGRVFLSASGVTHYLLTSPSPQAPLLFDLSKSTNRSRGAATSNATPAGYSPAQIATAYQFSGTSFGGITGDGSGQTIAIVDAFNDVGLVDSNSSGFLSSDLHVFDQQYGLPDPVFIKMSQTGSLTNLPAADPSGDWEFEESLDVEWAHAMAPRATILLVEANSQNQNSNSDPTDLLAAVDEARNYPGVVAVSMSWGYPEFSDEVNQDYHFTTPAGHTPVTFVASSGDNGTPGVWPAYSPNVVAVGGTTLTLNSNNTIASETAWSYNNSTGDGGGGGISTYEPLPAYQTGRVISGSTHRNIPDVAYDGDPNTGFPVYDSTKVYPYYPYKFLGYEVGWLEVGGTSAGSPQVAAMIAIADQGRQLNGSTSLDGPSQTLPEIYALGSAGSSDFRDIISGQTNVYAATYGYDCATGYGSIVVNSFVSDLLQI